MKKFIPIIAFGFLFTSCTQEEKKPAETEPTTEIKANESSLSIELSHLKTDLDTSWTRIDSGFINLTFSLNRLMQEIEYTKGYEVAQFNDLKSQISKLKKYRYTPSNIPDFETVGIHDENADAIISAVTTFASSIPEKEKYPLISELIVDIEQLNSQDIITYRTHYSNAVEAYNSFIGANKDALEKSGYTGLEPLPSYFLAQ